MQENDLHVSTCLAGARSYSVESQIVSDQIPDLLDQVVCLEKCSELLLDLIFGFGSLLGLFSGKVVRCSLETRANFITQRGW